MPDESTEGTNEIEVRVAKDAPPRVRKVALDLGSIFNGPEFKKKVLETVAEMLIEGKLEYDPDNDTFDIPEDRVKKWASKMEREVWSVKKRRKSRR